MNATPASPFASPSRSLVGLADELLGTQDRPVLDIGCGYGRNAVALAMRGLSVVCVDKDFGRLRTLANLAPVYMNKKARSRSTLGGLYPICANLTRCWPFLVDHFGAIICVQYLDISLFDLFRCSLISGGHLYIETFGGHGRNYLDLPRAGQLRDLLSKSFEFRLYREKKVGPPGHDAVSVTLLGKKK